MVVPESFRNEHLHGLAEEFFALVSEQFFGLRIDQDDSPVVSGDHHGVRRGIEQAAQAFFDALAVRNVADRGTNERTLGRRNRTEADFDRELGLVFAEAVEFEARSHGPHLRVAHESGAVAAVPPAQSFRHQSLDRLAQQFFAAIAEEFLRLRVDEDDAPLLIRRGRSRPETIR